MTSIKQQAKAIVGGLVAGAGAFVTAASDNSISMAEWGVIVVAMLSAYGAVYFTSNTDPQPDVP